MEVSAPAGWYDDGSGQQRWWDGRAWGVYAQDVSSVPGDPGAAGYGQVAGSVGQPAKSSGVFNALGQAVKNAAVERIAAGQRERQQRAEREWEQRRRYEERVQEERRRREEVERTVGCRVTGGVFGTSTIEIYENGYVRVAGPGDGVTVKSVRDSTPYERLISISMERSAGGVSSSAASGAEAVAMAGTAVKLVSTVAKGGSGLMKMSGGLGLAVTGAGQLAKMMAGKSVLTIVTDKKIHTLTNQVKTVGAPIVKRECESVGEALERAGNSVLTALGRGPVVPNVPALPSGQVEPPQRVSASPVSTVDVTASLRDLAQLHSEGFLDDEEFLEAKRQLLGKL
jgi:hypothetical protein